jgi:hypothetical protein
VVETDFVRVSKYCSPTLAERLIRGRYPDKA